VPAPASGPDAAAHCPSDQAEGPREAGLRPWQAGAGAGRCWLAVRPAAAWRCRVSVSGVMAAVWAGQAGRMADSGAGGEKGAVSASERPKRDAAKKVHTTRSPLPSPSPRTRCPPRSAAGSKVRPSALGMSLIARACACPRAHTQFLNGAEGPGGGKLDGRKSVHGTPVPPRPQRPPPPPPLVSSHLCTT